MKAMILAAGLGTRLKPLTINKPKALVEVDGAPMLERLIKKLILSDITEIIINVHHFAEHIESFLKSENNFGIRIEISNEKDKVLDTGGAIKKASWFFDDNQPFLLHNVDVLSDIDFQKMILFHNEKKSLVTLAVRNRDTSRYFLFNNKMTLCGWEKKTGMNRIITIFSRKEKLLSRFAFSGIHIIDPKIFDFMKQKGKFSIVDTYLDLSEKHIIGGFLHNDDFWLDLGKPESIEKANLFFKQS